MRAPVPSACHLKEVTMECVAVLGNFLVDADPHRELSKAADHGFIRRESRVTMEETVSAN